MINVEAMNKIDNIYTDGGESIININELPDYDEEPYDLSNPKSFDKYIDNLERIVRNSFEYRRFIGYLKGIEGMTECAVLENVSSNRMGSKVKIEIHHSPFTLYDICNIVVKKRIANNEDMNINAVAEEVLYLHYIAWVGLIPLSKTPHDTVHNAYMYISTNKVRGNYRAFIESYYNHINPELLDAIDAAEQAVKDNLEQKRMQIFNVHKMYVNVNGSYNIPEKDRVRGDIKTHIDQLKSNGRHNGPLKEMCVITNQNI